MLMRRLPIDMLVTKDVIAVYTGPDLKAPEPNPKAMTVRKLYVEATVNLGIPSFIFFPRNVLMYFSILSMSRMRSFIEQVGPTGVLVSGQYPPAVQLVDVGCPDLQESGSRGIYSKSATSQDRR
jgi:hypothetical protein